MGTSSGIRGLGLNYVVSQDESAAELYIDRGKESGDESQSMFDQLHEHRAEIEEAFGAPLSWERLEKKRACRIKYTQHLGGYRSPEDTWPEIQDAIIEAMNRFEQSLRPFLERLKLNG